MILFSCKFVELELYSDLNGTQLHNHGLCIFSFRTQFVAQCLKIEKKGSLRARAAITDTTRESASVMVRWKLAAAVYEVAYMHAARLCAGGEVVIGNSSGATGRGRSEHCDRSRKSSLRKVAAAPWVLCGEYLNQIKRHAVQEALKQAAS